MGYFKSFLGSASLFLGLLIAAVRPVSGDVQYEAKILFSMDRPSNFIGTSLPQPATARPQPAFGGQAVAAMSDQSLGGASHAFLWTGSGDPIDLHPTDPNIRGSGAIGTNGIQQIGWSSPNIHGATMDAMLWNGTAASAVSLKPNLPDIIGSYAYAAGGGQQIGYGFRQGGGALVPLLWDGTAASAREMPGELYATNGIEQVGIGSGADSVARPYVYKGSAASGIDLSPTNLGTIDSGWASGISPSGNEIVGSIRTTDLKAYALLWTADGATVRNINPTNLPGLPGADPVATNGTTIVGNGSYDGVFLHALVWVNGDPNNVIDLQSTLPATYKGSEAYGIDADGNIFGLVIAGQTYSAVEWSPVPEPATVLPLLATAFGIRRRRFTTV